MSILSVAYANNSPSPLISTLSDLRADAAERFNVAPENVICTQLNGAPADLNLCVDPHPTVKLCSF